MNWQSVFFSDQLYKAEIVKGVLEEKEINAVIVNKKDRAYQLGVYEVHVSAQHIIRALKIVDDDISFT